MGKSGYSNFLGGIQKIRRQSNLATGWNNPTPDDLYALGESYLRNELSYKYGAEEKNTDREIRANELATANEIRANEFATTNKIRADEAEAENRAAAVAGVGQIGLTGVSVYGMGKSAGWWGAGTAAKTAAAGTAGATTAGAGAGAGATAGATTGGMTLGAGATAAGVGAIGGKIATSLVGGANKETKTALGVAGGAAAGAAVGGPVGAVVGGVVGGISEAVGGSVICTELNRQGLLSDEVLKADTEYGQNHIDSETYIGYRIIADPIVRLMQKSTLFTKIVNPFASAFAHETASRVNKDIKGNRFGSVILWLGIPLCRKVFSLKYNNLEEVKNGITC